jgi:hypothetical protein
MNKMVLASIFSMAALSATCNANDVEMGVSILSPGGINFVVKIKTAHLARRKS